MKVTKEFAKATEWLPSVVIAVRAGEPGTCARNFATTQMAARTLLISAMLGVRSSVLATKLGTRIGKATLWTLSSTRDSLAAEGVCWRLMAD